MKRAAERRPGSPRRVLRAQAPLPAVPRWLVRDLVAVCALGLALAALVAYTAATPAAGRDFAVAGAPPDIRLQGFYDLEQNADGPFRWLKPEASLLVPVNRPATYRLTFTLQDGLAQGAGRTVALYVNGRAVGAFALTARPGDYTARYDLGPGDWLAHRRTLQVELASPALQPAGETRALGVMIRRAAIVPEAAPGPEWMLFLGPLLLLVVGYAVLRLLQLGMVTVAAVVVAALVALGLLAVLPRDPALFLVYQPVAHPLAFAALLGGMAALPALVWATERGMATFASGAGRWQRAGRVAVPAAITLLAGGLRLYHFNRLSLWLDEGATLFYAERSWPVVLGLRGWYDLHPPLYYTLAKLAALAVPEADAGRLVSVLSGTLTVAVAYALAARLAGRAVACCAALLLALSPLHIWYSQEARMYAPAMLFVAFSYLTLVAFAQATARGERRGPAYWWAVWYGVGVLLALYTVYSVSYALAPQALLLGLVVWRQRRRALPLLAALAVAFLGYLPWLPQLWATVAAARGIAGRGDYLAATPASVADSLLSLTGLGGGLARYTTAPLPWQRWADWQGFLVAGLVAATLLGAVLLARRSATALLVGLSLSAGTIGVAVALSQISPGYADRTILFAALGWALLVGGAALTLGKRPRWIGAAGLLSLLLALGLSCNALVALDRGGTKQRYRELIRDGQAAALATDLPILPGESWVTAFIRAYAPGSPSPQVHFGSDGRLVGADGRPADTGGLWFIYGDFPWDAVATTRQQLGAAGYERLAHLPYGDALYLDYYALPGSHAGVTLPLNGTFAGPADAATGWTLSPAGAQLLPEATGRRLVLGPRASARASVAATASGSAAVYTIEYDSAAPPGAGTGRVELSCLASNGATLALATSQDLALLPPVPNDGAWHTRRQALLCPPGTATLALVASSPGTVELSIRYLHLYEAVPTR